MIKTVVGICIGVGICLAGLGTSSAGQGSAGSARIFLAQSEEQQGQALHGQLVFGRVTLWLKTTLHARHVRYTVDGVRFVPTPRTPFRLRLDTTKFATGTHAVIATYRVGTIPQQARSTFRIQDLAVSANGSSGGNCTTSSPCRSWDRAYHIARPGQVVEIMSGTYPRTTIADDPAKRNASSSVIFRPGENQQVTIDGELLIQGSHVEFRNLAINGDWEVDPNGARPTSHVTFRNVSASNFYVNSSTDISVLGGSLGPTINVQSQIKALDGGVQPARIVIDGVSFHDYVRTDPDVHMECLQVLSADTIAVRNSRFQRCAVMDLYFSQFGSAGATRNVVVENNFFDSPTSGGFYAVYVGSQLGIPPTNFLFRNNSLTNSVYIDTNAGTSNVSFIANVGPRAQYNCPDGVTFAYNVWDAAKCGQTDVRAPLGFKDPAALDLHLVARAAALNHGDPGSFPARDIDGQKRPRGKRPDAGADEAG